MSFENPTITLDRIVLERLDLSGGSMDLVFRVYNPNAFQIRGTALDVELALQDVPFGELVMTNPLALPARDTTEVGVPFAFSWSGVGAGARALFEEGGVRYSVDGGLRVETPFGEGRVPYRRSGSISLIDRRADAGGAGR